MPSVEIATSVPWQVAASPTPRSQAEHPVQTLADFDAVRWAFVGNVAVVVAAAAAAAVVVVVVVVVVPPPAPADAAAPFGQADGATRSSSNRRVIFAVDSELR